jgi:hypothetical protein
LTKITPYKDFRCRPVTTARHTLGPWHLSDSTGHPIIVAAYWGMTDLCSICPGGPALPRLRPLDHCSHRLRVERLAALIAVARLFEPGTDFPVAQSTSFAFRPPKATRFRHHLRPQLGVVRLYSKSRIKYRNNQGPCCSRDRCPPRKAGRFEAARGAEKDR